MATDDVEDLDLDELDTELTDQLGDEDLEPRERHTLSEIRAALRRTKGKLERAFEDGKTAGRDEQQRDTAWKAAGIPERVRALLGDVDPRDSDALAAKVGELQADGIRWGSEAEAVTARVEEQARTEALSRMAGLAAGGSVPDAEDDKANSIKARIDAGQPVTDDEQQYFQAYVGGALDAFNAGAKRGW